MSCKSGTRHRKPKKKNWPLSLHEVADSMILLQERSLSYFKDRFLPQLSQKLKGTMAPRDISHLNNLRPPLLTRRMEATGDIFHLNNLRPPLLTRRIEAPRGMKVVIRVVVTASSIQTVLLCYVQIMCAIDALRRGSAAHTIYEFYKGRRCSSEIT